MSREQRRGYGYPRASDTQDDDQHVYSTRGERYTPSPEVDRGVGVAPATTTTTAPGSAFAHMHGPATHPAQAGTLPWQWRTFHSTETHIYDGDYTHIYRDARGEGDATTMSAPHDRQIPDEESDMDEDIDIEETFGDADEEDDTADEEEVEETEVVSLEALTERMKENSTIDVVGLGSSGAAAAVWTVSSAKHSSGVSCLLDWGNSNSYWQSDGPLPHTVSVQFQKLTAVQTVCVLLCHSEDESYTPKVISVKAGTHDGDMAEVAGGTVAKPHGWVLLDVGGNSRRSRRGDRAQGGAEAGGNALGEDSYRVWWCTRLEIVFPENHENGRDCHVRGIRVLGPSSVPLFSDPVFTQHLVLR